MRPKVARWRQATLPVQYRVLVTSSATTIAVRTDVMAEEIRPARAPRSRRAHDLHSSAIPWIEIEFVEDRDSLALLLPILYN